MVEKTRPVLILNVAFADTDRSLYTVIPRTTTLRGSQFEIGVSVSFLKAGAFLVQQPVTIPPVRLLRRLGTLSTEEMALVEAGVRHWLGL
jgi:mRNA interferase MazF